MSRTPLSWLLLAGLCGAAGAAAGPRFADRAAALGPAHVYAGGWAHFVGGGVAAFDCNGDGWPDLAAAGGETPARLWVNATPAPGADLVFAPGTLPPMTGVTGIWPLDIDSDGTLDLAVTRAGPDLLLRGLGGCRFAPAADWGLPPEDTWSTAFSATWEPGADWPTLAIGTYVDRADPDGPFGACDALRLYRPGGAGYGAAELLEPGYCALSILFSDWQQRGRADLRVSNDRHYYLRGGAEQMWRLDPEPHLLGPEQGWPRLSIWGMGIASGDVDGDGWADVALTSMGDQLLFWNEAGQGWREAPYGTGTHATRPHVGDDGRPSTGWHAQFGDVDNDGRPDLFIAKGNVDQMPENAMHDPNNLLMQQPDGTFAEAAASAGIATMARGRGAALVDLNRDGRLDLAVVNRRAPMELWQNITPGTGHWVALDIRQEGPNPRAIGARVELRLPDGRHLMQEITVGGGHGGGQAGPLHFGLGAATGAEARVIWPDGTVSAWQPVTPDAETVLTRQAGPSAPRR